MVSMGNLEILLVSVKCVENKSAIRIVRQQQPLPEYMSWFLI